MSADATTAGVPALVANLRINQVTASIAAVLIVLGIAAGAAGVAWGALLILAAVGMAARVDARLPVLLLVLLLPPVTLFNALPAFVLGGSIVDFRLLMTGGVALLLLTQLAFIRPHWDVVGVVAAIFLALLVAFAPLNDIAPLRAIAPIARFSDYLLAFLVARRVLTSPGDGHLVLGSLLISLSVVAISGVIQFIAGGALEMNDAKRLAGLYVTSPVGLGMAMELGLLILWTIFIRRGKLNRQQGLAAGLFMVFLFVMLETSTRLVFVSLVVGLGVTELLHHRLRIAAAILLAAVLIVASDAELAGRIGSTVGAQPPSPVPSSATQGPPSPGQVIDANPEGLPGDASLRYRLYIWLATLPEWAQSPLVGRGTGSFAVLLERRTGIQREAPHNDYWGLLVETGIVGLSVYLVLQLTILTTALVRWRLTRIESSRALLMAAGMSYLALSVLSVLNNPILFFDLQLILWVLLGVAFSMPRLPPGQPAVVSFVQSRRGIVGSAGAFSGALRTIWRERPTELRSASPIGVGVSVAARLAGVNLVVAPSALG